MDLSKLKDLIELMNRHQLEELEIEEEGFRARLRKKGETIKEVVTVPAVGSISPASAMPAAAGAETPVDTGSLILSPMVGTFYQSPSPDAEAFVEVGDRIEEGTVLCIIEAMKVMNEVKSDRSGTIEEVLAENSTPVEYGQPLFRIS